MKVISIFELSRDNIISIIIDNQLSLQNLQKLYNTSKEFNNILNFIKLNWFKIVEHKNKNIYYRIYNAPSNSIINNYMYIYHLINNVSTNKKYIIIHYLFVRYNFHLKYKNDTFITHKYLHKLCNQLLTSSSPTKLTNYTEKYLKLSIKMYIE